MSHCAHLYAKDNDSIAWDESATLIAETTSILPLLWIALFRPDDLRHETFNANGQEFSIAAPITPISKAVSQLKDILPFLNEMFAEQGQLDDYFTFLTEALTSSERKNVTSEFLDLIAIEQRKGIFIQRLSVAIEALQQRNTNATFVIPSSTVPNPFGDGEMVIDERPLNNLQELLVSLCGLKLDAGFLPADCFLIDCKVSEIQKINHDRLIGFP